MNLWHNMKLRFGPHHECSGCGNRIIGWPPPDEHYHRCAECARLRKQILDNFDWGRLAEGLGVFAQYLRDAKASTDDTTLA
jgi:hypothetical protein